MKVETRETLAPVHIYNRCGPTFPSGAEFISPTVNNQVYSTSLQEYQVWLLARLGGSSGEKQNKMLRLLIQCFY